MTKLIMRLARKICWNMSVVWLSMRFFCDRVRNKKVVVFYMQITGQVIYVAPLIEELSRREHISCYLAYGGGVTGKVSPLSNISSSKMVDMKVCKYAHNVDAFISPDQWEAGPSSARLKICIFHGQPTKGNTFLPENISLFNNLFLLGPLQRSLYEKFALEYPDIAINIQAHNIGYPKTDKELQRIVNRVKVLESLGLNPMNKTVIYAPAWDPGCSLRMYGVNVIKNLLEIPAINVIVKLHPATLEPRNSPKYEFYTGGIDWIEQITHIEKINPRLRYVNEPDTSLYLGACDVMVTDFSGVAFDFMFLDRPVVYIDCPEFFEVTLKQYGSDPDLAKNDDRFNAGRNYGDVIYCLSDIEKVVNNALNNPYELSAKRKIFTDSLLYNPGCSTKIAAETVCELLGH